MGRKTGSEGRPQKGLPGGVAGTALIDKAFHLVDLVAETQGALSATELIAQTGWSRATVYRILNALRDRGYLRFDPLSKAYSLGYHFVEIAQRFWTSADLTAIASAELQRLRDVTGETAYLAVLQSGTVLSLGKFESPHPVRSAARLGVRKPLHCTSQGKAILAFLPEEEAAALLGPQPYRRYTPRTIVEGDVLRQHLRIVRSRGYAVEDEEILLGNRCVGAPILDADRVPVGAISVAGPVYRLTPERVDRLGPEVAAAARNIGAALRPPPAPAVSRSLMSPVPEQRVPAFHGASPIWETGADRLLWIDRLAPCVHSHAGSNTTLLLHPPDEAPLAGALLGTAGRIAVFAGERVFLYRDAQLQVDAPLDGIGQYTASCVDGEGIPWLAAMRGDAAVIGRLEEDGSLDIRWRTGSRVSAMAWSPEGGRLFTADADRGMIHIFETASERPRILTRVAPVSGRPEALAIDGRGRPWVALSDGWGIAILGEDGEFELVVPVPVPRPTGLAFGGRDGRSLFVTTARFGLTREVLENSPLSGLLFSLPLDLATPPQPVAAYLPWS